jgi:hypothetical protein
MLPKTCLLQKRLILLASGYRNILGRELLGDDINKIVKPAGSKFFLIIIIDLVFSTFPNILDNPDICEILIPIFQNDVV